MIQPKKTKYKKFFRGKISGRSFKGNKLAFGNFGIKILKSGRIKACQLESIRKSILKKLKSKSKLWITIFPYLAVSAKPIDIRMGKGKGPISYWCFPLKAGRILFELQEKSVLLPIEILKIVKIKLGLSAIIIYQ